MYPGSLSLSLALLTLIASPGAEEEIAPRPLEGAVRWTLSLHGDLSSAGPNDWAVLGVFLGYSRELTGARFFWDRKIACVDELVDGERRRTFEALEGEVSFTANSGAEFLHERKALGSELEGRTVAFRRPEPDAEPVVTFADGEPGEGWLLDDLWSDPEPLALLPEKAVQYGERWRVAPELFVSTLLPGGDARIREVELGGIEEILLTAAVLTDLGRDAAFLGGEFEGTVWATWSGEVDRDGERLAKIELEIDVDRSGKLGSPLRRLADPAWGWGEAVFGERLVVDCRLRGEGLLYWNLDRGRLDSLELRLRTETSAIMGLGLEGTLDLDLTLEQVVE